MEQHRPTSHPLFAELRELARSWPLVVAHRGDSGTHPENTLPAFTAASTLGVHMQEFDVQVTADGELVCCHDLTLDRTTDSASVLGPGLLVAQCTVPQLRMLDAGRWKAGRFAGTRVPTLAQALAVITADAGIALIEHKAGQPDSFVEHLSRDHTARRILQSFDWMFVANCARIDSNLALAVLGPNAAHPQLDEAACSAALASGAGMVHWSKRHLRREQVDLAHRAGLLVCTYTTDDDAGMLGGAAMGVDAMCTNVPGRMLALRSSLAHPVRNGSADP